MIKAMTAYGAVSGTAEDCGAAFLGIPYAKAPVGELRFRPPQKPEKWEGVKECVKYGSPSLQLLNENHVLTDRILKISSEDCLYLNVRTPAPLIEAGGDMIPDSDAGLPVYIFVHGGAFISGGSNLPLYEGHSFAKDGIVYVNINYRLSVMGSLALEALEAESGMTGCWQVLDVMQAVKWVYENIKAFGGDPENITLGGQSAGACIASAVISMPEMKGMIKRCILESASLRTGTVAAGFGRGNRGKLIGAGKKLMADLGLEDTPEGVEKLRELPADVILKKWHFGEDGKAVKQNSNPVLEGFLFDGDYVPDPRIQYINDVDLLFGYNTHEGSLFVNKSITAEEYEANMKSYFPHDWQEVLEKYPVNEEYSAWDRMSDIEGTMKFKASMLPYADALAARGNAVYGYHFDYMTEKLEREGMGVRHIAELHFVFDRALRVVGADDEAGHDMAEIMHECWCRFIKTGSPDSSELKEKTGISWQPYNAEGREVIKFSEDGISFAEAEDIDKLLWIDILLDK